MVLARAPKGRIGQREAYQLFQGLDAEDVPAWTDDIGQRGAVFTYPGLCRRSGISYTAGLRRYLWWQQRAEAERPPHLREDVDTRFSGGFGIYDAPEPWGPWTTVYSTAEWDTGPGEMGSLPSKWMNER